MFQLDANFHVKFHWMPRATPPLLHATASIPYLKLLTFSYFNFIFCLPLIPTTGGILFYIKSQPNLCFLQFPPGFRFIHSFSAAVKVSPLTSSLS